MIGTKITVRGIEWTVTEHEYQDSWFVKHGGLENTVRFDENGNVTVFSGHGVELKETGAVYHFPHNVLWFAAQGQL